MATWVLLPDHVRPAQWNAVQSRLKRDMRQAFAAAGIRSRLQNGRVAVRADNPGPFVYTLPLQTADGRIRANASKTLARDTFGGGLEGGATAFLRQRGLHETDVDRWTGLRLAFLQQTDPPTAVRDLALAQPECRLYRLGATPRLMYRQVVWRIIGHLIDGVPADEMPLGTARTDSMLISGLLEAAPAAIACAPLTARFQPLAAVLMTNAGAEVAMLAYGSGYVRMSHLDRWPVGVGRPSLTGPGTGVYNVGIDELPAGHAAALLTQSIEGMNKLLHLLTDPTRYADANKVLDIDEQLIAWANVRFGFEAINSMSTDWGTTEAVWAAFRALGVLQGIWEGARQGSVPLWELLTPARIRTNALPAITDPTHRVWCDGLVNNYERELREGFPGETLDQAARHIQELRHLVHGVGGQGKRPRDARLASLRYLAHHNPNIQLVCDMASLWWTALLFDPERLCTPGRAPWRNT